MRGQCQYIINTFWTYNYKEWLKYLQLFFKKSDQIINLDKTVKNVKDIAVHNGQCNGSTINF